MRRGLFALAGLVGVGIAAGVAFERRGANERERLDIYFDDGSFVTYVDGSSGAEELLPLARRVLAKVRGEE